MKLNHLALIAYGPFADQILNFADRGASLHLIYGPNEAGKSTALRALRNLLFGIPVRSPDNFRYPHPKLRIGAELVRSDGEILTFIRRKGLRKTLRGQDDQTLLDDAVLRTYLGGVDRELFEQMFAIDHQDLVQGGEEIIAGGGRIGQALFAAGGGLIRLQQVQQGLNASLEALFKPGGVKPHINHTLALLKTAHQNQKQALLLAKTWKTHHDNLQTSQARQEVNRQGLSDRRQAYHKLERIHEALPLIARRKEISAALTGLAGVAELPDDFTDKRRMAENALAVARHDAQRAEISLAEIRAKIEALAVPETLLTEAPLVEALQHDLGSYKKAQQDRPALEARRQTLDRQAAETLARAGLSDPSIDADPLQVSPALISDIQALGQTHDRLNTLLASARQRRRELETDLALLESRKQKLLPLTDVRALQTALQIAVGEGPLEKRRAEIRSALSHGEKILRDRLSRQSLWSGPLEALKGLPCPARRTIERFEKRYATCAQTIERRQADIEHHKGLLDDIAAELRSLESTHQVPTENDLLAARARRDEGWRLVRQHLEGQPPEERKIRAFIRQIAKGQALVEAFEAGMIRVDHIADRLRREAEQVGRKSMLEARRHQVRDQHAEAAAALAAAHAERDDLEQEWHSLWTASGIHPLPPAEMLGWLAEIDAVRDKAADLEAEQCKADNLTATIERLRSSLSEALAHVGAPPPATCPLAELIERARGQIASQEARKEKIERIDQTMAQHRKDLQKVVLELEELDGEQKGWQTTWRRTVSRLGQDADTAPGAALAVIESLRQARRQRNEAADLKERIQGIDRDADLFREGVAQLTARLAPEWKDISPEEACLRLNARLTEARAAQSRKLTLERQQEALQHERHQARKCLAEATAAVQALCREAACEDPAQLPAIEKRSRQRLALLGEQEDLENRLRRLGAGATVEAFTAEAEMMDADTLIPQMEAIAEDLGALERERSALDQAIGTARAELQRMDGRAEAAGYAEQAEHLLAALDADVARYARLKIAAAMLARTVEHYREKHQGPLIQRASVLFARMTLKAFSGLRAEYDPKGHPVLVAIRSGSDELVSVPGMSDGTADQLYLALRLASLERYLEASEPLPFVVDDILLRFDDDRAAATLEVLAALAQKTQVIFFTHHRHLVALARQTLGNTAVQFHFLGDQTAGPSRN
jgi:uncharacterized protein YhaN